MIKVTNEDVLKKVNEDKQILNAGRMKPTGGRRRDARRPSSSTET